MRVTTPRRRRRVAKLFALMRRGEGAKAVAAAMIAKRNHALRRRQSIDAARYRVAERSQSGGSIRLQSSKIVEDDDCSERSQSAVRCSVGRSHFGQRC